MQDLTEMNDEQLLQAIYDNLKACDLGDAYAGDGSFARANAALHPGLQAMAATHWLDLSLTLDSLSWHFGNFGEPHLVEQTEAGLRTLKLVELADVFRKSKELMLPAIEAMPVGAEFPDYLEALPSRDELDRLDRRAWDLNRSEGESDVITEAWITYTRTHPEVLEV